MTTETTEQLLCSCCGGASSPPQHFCATCEHILPMPDRVSYFEFMELPIQLSLDARLLQQTFYRLSRQFHPDYYQNRPGPEQKAALERSAALNRAYDTLQDTVKRVEYYMKLVGFVSEGKKNQVPPDLMMEILDLQEKLDDQQSASPEQKLALAREIGVAIAGMREKLEEASAKLEDLCVQHDQADLADRAAFLQQLRDTIDRSNYLRRIIQNTESVSGTSS